MTINIIEIEADDGEYANEVLPFTINAADYIGKKILAVPRCCQHRKGSQDRKRVNGSVAQRRALDQGIDRKLMEMVLMGNGLLFNGPPKVIRNDPVPRPPTGRAKEEEVD